MTTFEKMADLFGFVYDSNQDIYVTKKNCLQRLFGYGSLYDYLSLPSAMIIDIEPITFNYRSHRYLIELWKGQYNVMTGCEVGVYHRYRNRHHKDVMWKCVADDKMLDISYRLMRTGSDIPIVSRHCLGWWVTGFKPGLFSKPSDLILKDVSIQFTRKKMCKSFVNALTKLGYVPSVREKLVRFDFTIPKTPQPWPSTIRQIGLATTNGMVSVYNSIKSNVNGTDNSPSTIDKMLM